MINMEFNAADLDASALLSRAKEESEQIFAGTFTRRGRTLQKIIETSMYGHAAELYLIEKCQFEDDPRKYKDLFDTEGNPVEVKVTEGDYYVHYVLDRATKAKSEEWRGFPDILYVFIGDKITADYSLYGIYKWSENKFVLQKATNIV
jgi:hypothetical protein